MIRMMQACVNALVPASVQSAAPRFVTFHPFSVSNGILLFLLHRHRQWHHCHHRLTKGHSLLMNIEDLSFLIYSTPWPRSRYWSPWVQLGDTSGVCSVPAKAIKGLTLKALSCLTAPLQRCSSQLEHWDSEKIPPAPPYLHHHFRLPKLQCSDLDAEALRIQICLMFPVFWETENAQIRSFGTRKSTLYSVSCFSRQSSSSLTLRLPKMAAFKKKSLTSQNCCF